MISFEIPNIGRTRVCRFVQSSLGCHVTRHRKSDDFADFRVGGRKFVITELWGDNSRFTVSEIPAKPSDELTTLREGFERLRRFYLF